MKTLTFGARAWLLLGLLATGCVGAPVSEDEALVGHVDSPLSAASSKLWKPPFGATELLITTCFENGTQAEKDFVRTTSESSWEAIGTNSGAPDYGVDFRGWTTCAATTSGILRIRFFSASDPVEVAGDPTDTSFTRGAGTATVTNSTNISSLCLRRSSTQIVAPFGATTVIHELGHILGFEHEFLRPDSTEPCAETAGNVPDLGITGVDPTSVMDADSCTRSSTLTETDKLGFSVLYGPWSLTNTWPVTNALRLDSSGLFVWIVPGATVPFASSAAITARTDLRVLSLESSGAVSFGGRVRIVAPDGRFFVEDANTNVSTASSALNSTVWRVRGRFTSGTVRVNDEVIFQSASGRYLSVNANRRLVTVPSGVFWRLQGHSAIHF